MARLNIEDSIFKDRRFYSLIEKCGSYPTALGELIITWITAQKYYLSHGEIPFEIWKKQNCSDAVIDVGLATRTETGVRVCGQDEQFAWLYQKREAGKKSAETKNSKRKLKKLSKTSQHTLTYVEQPLTHVNDTLTSSLFSLSSSLSSPDSSLSAHHSIGGSGGIPADAGVPAMPPKENLDWYMESWNQNCGELKPINKISPDRARWLKKLIKEFPDRQDWLTGIQKIASSTFCNGGKDKQGWHANFNWFIKPENFIKALEGNYDDRKYQDPKQAEAERLEKQRKESRAFQRRMFEEMYPDGIPEDKLDEYNSI